MNTFDFPAGAPAGRNPRSLGMRLAASVFTGEGKAGIAGIDLGYGGIVLAPQP